MNQILTIIVSVVLLIVIISVIRSYFFNQKLVRIASKRSKLNRHDFIRQMELQGFEYHKISETYDEIKKYLEIDEFDIYPEDDLLRLYKIDDMDLDDMIARLINKFDQKIPSEQECNKIFDLNNQSYNSIFILKLLHLE